jgi:hypothetical protein
MTVQDFIEELEKCPNKDRDIVIKEDDILHRIVGVYIDSYLIGEVD